ncbi:hypothetical protein GW17_00009522 [Ensete ventricosum]|nr:hypothetical protein GW17_00009522 [Ensete ventricosum]
MEPDASALLLDALQSCDYRGLYDRFASFLLPFGDFVPLHSHNLNPPATKKGATTTTSYSVSATAAPKKRGLPKKKKKLEPDPAALRPLAKQFLPFLCRALKHLPALLRKSPKSTNADVDDGRTVELLAVYRLLLDCLACIGPCLAGKPYSVHLQRGRLVVCLEACGRYAEAEEEALALLESLGAILVEAASMPKSRKIKIAGGGCFLPDPAQVNADDPEITMLVIEVITVLSGCAYKSKIRKEVAYERILTLIDQVQPWLRYVFQIIKYCLIFFQKLWIKQKKKKAIHRRFLNPEALQKYQILLVNTLYKCSLFLVEEYTDFEKELVQRFCLRMLRECINSRSVYHFASVCTRITVGEVVGGGEGELDHHVIGAISRGAEEDEVGGGYRYVDHPLLGGTVKSIVGGRLKKEEEKKKEYLAPSSPVCHRHPHPRAVVALSRRSPASRRCRRPWVACEPSPPLLAIFLLRREKD